MDTLPPPLVVRQRLEEWESWQIAVPLLQEENRILSQENRSLRKQIRLLKQDYEAKIEALEWRVEQLTQMVFGPPKGDRPARRMEHAEAQAAQGKAPRPPQSYRRAVPGEEEVTSRRTFPRPACPRCGGKVTDRE